MRCRICRDSLTSILDLGPMPLANGFIGSKDDIAYERKYPLRLGFCESCRCVQLMDSVNPSEMFDDYPYLTSASKPLVEHFSRYREDLIDRFGWPRSVLDIGSNDGTFIGGFPHGIDALGIEPAKNVAAIARSKEIRTINDYWSEQRGKDFRHRFDIITANNVLAHVPDPHDFIRGVLGAMAPKGVFVFEVPWVVNMIRGTQFDTIYHEHSEYFGLRPLINLLASHDLTVFDARLVPVQGGSLRVYSCKDGKRGETGTVDMLLRDEDNVVSLDCLEQFAIRASNIKYELVEMLRNLKEAQRKITGYGAAARGNILLNYCGIDGSLLDYVTDTTPLKQGKLTPGTHIPVVDPEMMRFKTPNYALMLVWTYRSEILSRGKVKWDWIVPLPKPEIIESLDLV